MPFYRDLFICQINVCNVYKALHISPVFNNVMPYVFNWLMSKYAYSVHNRQLIDSVSYWHRSGGGGGGGVIPAALLRIWMAIELPSAPPTERSWCRNSLRQMDRVERTPISGCLSLKPKTDIIPRHECSSAATYTDWLAADRMNSTVMLANTRVDPAASCLTDSHWPDLLASH